MQAVFICFGTFNKRVQRFLGLFWERNVVFVSFWKRSRTSKLLVKSD